MAATKWGDASLVLKRPHTHAEVFHVWASTYEGLCFPGTVKCCDGSGFSNKCSAFYCFVAHQCQTRVDVYTIPPLLSSLRLQASNYLAQAVLLWP